VTYVSILYLSIELNNSIFSSAQRTKIPGTQSSKHVQEHRDFDEHLWGLHRDLTNVKNYYSIYMDNNLLEFELFASEKKMSSLKGA
jgi:hypothetical protein